MSDGNFKHIYYNDWEIGASYERKVKKDIVYLGTLVSKELIGRPYDEDIKLKFDNDGKIIEHVMDFDRSYRKSQ